MPLGLMATVEGFSCSVAICLSHCMGIKSPHPGAVSSCSVSVKCGLRAASVVAPSLGVASAGTGDRDCCHSHPTSTESEAPCDQGFLSHWLGLWDRGFRGPV